MTTRALTSQVETKGITMEIELQYRISEKFSDGSWQQAMWETARFVDATDARLYVASLINEVLKAQGQGRRLYVGFGPNVLKSGVIIEPDLRNGGGVAVSARRTGYVPRGVTTRDSFGNDALGAATAVMNALAEPRR
jgi:hypothetical protein